MYKLTFEDYRCRERWYDLVSYYVDSLYEFEKHWLREPTVSVETINQYFRSKFGIQATDFWTIYEVEENNIVQEDAFSEIISEISYQYTDKTILTYNVNNEEDKYHFDKLTIYVRKVKYEDKYILLAKYYAEGVAEVYQHFDKKLNKSFKYINLSYYGNPVAHLDSDLLDFVASNDKEPYKNTSLKSFAWTKIDELNDGKKLPKNFRLNKDQTAYLFGDIPGYAG